MRIKLTLTVNFNAMFSSSGHQAFNVIVSMVAVAFLIPVYTAIIRYGHSISDDLYHLFVYTTCTVFWWKMLTKKPVELKKNI